MKRAFLLPLFIGAIATTAVISCGKDKPQTSVVNENETSTDGLVYVLDTINSKVEWKGYKIFKSDNSSHFGTLKFESGTVTVENGKLQSGNFVADMNSLQNIDLEGDEEQKVKLESHLKTGDFFEVEKFPTASFQITKISETEGGDYNTILDGNLTIKGITKPVQFLANVVVKDSEISIATQPTDINREDFGVKFQIPIANGVIKNEMNVQILVKANVK